MDFIAIDFEASCLPRHGRSYPIEVGISGADGRRSWLIEPSPLWRDWDWTDEAAGLHGISRELLDHEGLPADVVFAELAAAIAGRRVFADSHIDADWWSMLAASAGRSGPNPVEHVSVFLDEAGANAVKIADAMRLADGHCPERHRAGFDADWLWQVMAELAGAGSDRYRLRRAA